MWDYNEKVKDHFLNPRNVGDMQNPDAVGDAGSLSCGDQMKLMLRIGSDEKIMDAKFQTFGCGSAVASASVLTEMIIGKTLDEAGRITNRDIVDQLGGLPAEKMHCSVMGEEALEAAIAEYRAKTSGHPIEKKEKKVVCQCFGVTEEEILRVVKENRLSTVQDVTNYTKAGGGCMACHEMIQEIIDKVRGLDQEKKSPENVPGKKLSNIQKMKLVEETIEKQIRPMLQADGGDLELIDIQGDKVLIALRGMCSSCVSSQFTVKKYIEPKLKEFVAPELYIEEVKP